MLDENQRREIELAENLDRKDLTPAERSRHMVELAEVAAEADRVEKERNPSQRGTVPVAQERNPALCVE